MGSSRISRVSRVEAVIGAAWRRRFFVLGFEQLAVALSLILAGGILMLLVGTQILNWYWLLLLGFLGLAVATARIRACMLTRYRVAQLLDRKLQLSDSLSTAWFVLSRAGHETELACRIQLEQAERVAAGVKPSLAFPFVGQRTWAVTGALAGVAFGLFATRYLVTGSLNLQQAFLPTPLAAVFERIEKSLSGDNHRLFDAEGGSKQEDISPHATGRQQNDGKAGLLGSPDSKTGKPDGLTGESSASQTAVQDNKSLQDGQRGSHDSSRSPAQPNQPGAPERGGNNQQSDKESPNANEQQTANQQTSSGLVDKMKDALSSLMAKMRPNSDSRQSAQNNEPPSNDQKGGDQMMSNKDEKSRSQQDARNEQPHEQQSSEGQAQGQTTEKAQPSQGRNSDQSADKKGSDAHSGVGRQDGDKDVKEAEQLRAMGKLAEIIGKRSANLRGEMMVETRSGKQQLKTEYSQRMGHHSDLGGEINRDEIPLMYQQYIREYMEKVRKQQAKSGE